MKQKGKKMNSREFFMEKREPQFSLKRLDSFHLNQLTAKAFESGSPVKTARYDDGESSASTSPLKKLGKMKLEAIDEADSFCTDSSYQSEALLNRKR